jgi:hypothetical protein
VDGGSFASTRRWEVIQHAPKERGQKFYFESERDFTLVCMAAGLEPDGLGSRFQRIKKSVPQPTAL